MDLDNLKFCFKPQIEEVLRLAYEGIRVEYPDFELPPSENLSLQEMRCMIVVAPGLKDGIGEKQLRQWTEMWAELT